MTTALKIPKTEPFTDLPPPLGEVVAEYRIAPGKAVAYSVTAGQYIQIIDVAGSQCSDFLAFGGDRYSDPLDATVTRTLTGLAVPQAGLPSKLFSQAMQPLTEVIQDTCGHHDSFLLACTARYYEDAGYPGHPSCSDNFNRVLAPYGIAPRPGWPALNFFYNTSVDGHGAIGFEEPLSRPGDYVLLLAHQDLLCASSSCPDDIDPANDWHPTPIHVRIYAAGQRFARAMGQRVAADLPLRMTQDSAFTPSIRQLTDDLAEYNGFWVPQTFAHQGDQAEYWALRQRAALMDLSALRKFEVQGADAFALLQYAFSRNLEKVAAGQGAYGCLLNPHGGIVDDGIVFCFGPSRYRYVGNCDTDAAWLRQIAQAKGWSVAVDAVEFHNLALQGPLSRDLLKTLVPEVEALGYFRFLESHIQTIPVLISRTGYTGELGYELFVHPKQGAALWDILLQAGTPAGLLPLGMKALDRARIEAGLLAMGYEFDDLTSPYQAGIGWAVAMKKPDFIGKAALDAIRLHPPRVAVGLVLEGPEVAAHGQPVFAAGERWRVGQITSATFSPILNASIAMAQVVPEFAKAGTRLEVGMLDGLKRRVRATVGSLAAFDPTKSRVRI
ncbi:MAG: glycine cleavage protein T [Shackletoniella antarctica]|uniref:Glycine cleavage protein T n=1 Tax=Shackletoniella antarctica TaxID=268115 RepID=A0A2W4W526_9CYAN|nr:MAG: glycine cleavage protein T [Shackletoniella antarctica]